MIDRRRMYSPQYVFNMTCLQQGMLKQLSVNSAGLESSKQCYHPFCVAYRQPPIDLKFVCVFEARKIRVLISNVSPDLVVTFHFAEVDPCGGVNAHAVSVPSMSYFVSSHAVRQSLSLANSLLSWSEQVSSGPSSPLHFARDGSGNPGLNATSGTHGPLSDGTV